MQNNYKPKMKRFLYLKSEPEHAKRIQTKTKFDGLHTSDQKNAE